MPIPWLGDVPDLNVPLGLEEYAADTAPLDIAGMVYVEVDVAPQFALLEAEAVVKLAEREPRLLGIVAAAPVEYGLRARRYLDALQRLGPLIKGVRRNLQGEREAAFCLTDDFITGVRMLADYDWSFDICIRHDQLPAVTALVRHCPDVRFVLDHMGKPPIRQHQLDPWRDHLTELAALPNVWCKVSGLVTEADHEHWRAEDLLPYIAHGLRSFGAERLLFGGDWPVARLAATYQQWVTVLESVLQDFATGAQSPIWGDTARGVYRLARES